MSGAMVAGAFLSASLQVLFDRMACRELVDFLRGHKQEDQLLKKLKLALLSISTVLDDAEEKQISSPAVKEWLDEVKDVIYEAEDIIDEISTKALQCKAEAEFQIRTREVQNFDLSSLNLFTDKIESKMEEILSRLEYMSKQKVSFGLQQVPGRKTLRKLPTTSLIDDHGVYGRDEDKDAITELLLSNDAGSHGNKLCVITFVGMAGVGKTTLAQLLYNNEKVKEHFDLLAWVYVSEEFDVFRVTRTILEAITSAVCDIKDLNLLQVRLKENLMGKKFLLVLDDVWNENYIDWEILRGPFIYGAQGSKIIVTTRNDRVASIMRTVPTHHLKQLSDDDCWSLFAKHAFDNGNISAHQELEVIGREILRKCKGLPLAVKTLGGLLRSKTDIEEWYKILKSNIWDLSNEQSNILPALKLSYHYLPPYLKRCFAYCSIFPKDYVFEKEHIIRLWMAEDFLQPWRRNQTPEEVGEEYFQNLVSRSFFQRTGANQSQFVMHDLFNDLAKFVSGEFCSRLESHTSNEITRRIRHLSYSPSRYDTIKKFAALHEAKCLRTFLPLRSLWWLGGLSIKVLHDVLPKLSHLRALSLSNYSNITELPDSLGNLKQLRYLDFSRTRIEKLPDSVISLCNLQTLILADCGSLIELPANMGRLVNLRHLDISRTSFKEMPQEISGLKSLRTLTAFVLSKQNSIRELAELKHLHGILAILKLQNIANPEDALEANLKNKIDLDELVLRWERGADDSQIVRHVLDNLQPHTNLKKLTIEYYGGTSFPGWLGAPAFTKLEHLHLLNCKYCCFLPPLGQLPSLKDLTLIGFDIETVGNEFYGSSSSTTKPFRSLEILKFSEMSEWHEWFSFKDHGNCNAFPRLQELHIRNCPKLTGVLPSYLPSLRKLVISGCKNLVSSLPRAPTIREFQLTNCNKMFLMLPRGLQRITIHEIDGLKFLPQELVHSNLQELSISHCSSLLSLPAGGLPSTLKTLEIEKCANLELPMQPNYTSLEYLVIKSSCTTLTSIHLDLFPSLNQLIVWDCENLETLLVSEESHRLLTSLGSLKIFNCPKFVSFPKGGLCAPNLTCLSITGCKKLTSLPEHMETMLPSLINMGIYECPELDSFPPDGLPSSLKLLVIWDCEKLVSHRLGWGLQRLPSFKTLAVHASCEDVKSFPDEALLPTTLTSLTISRLPKLKQLDSKGIQHLTCLQDLKIENCPMLESMPERPLPTSLCSLQILNCPLLKKECQREKGKYWSKIAHIPISCSSVCSICNLLYEFCSNIFGLFLELDAFATITPSFLGSPRFFSIITLQPFCAIVTFTASATSLTLIEKGLMRRGVRELVGTNSHMTECGGYIPEERKGKRRQKVVIKESGAESRREPFFGSLFWVSGLPGKRGIIPGLCAHTDLSFSFHSFQFYLLVPLFCYYTYS